MKFFTNFRIAGIAVFVIGLLLLLALNAFKPSTPVTFDSKKAELIQIADAEKLSEIAKAELAESGSLAMAKEATIKEDNAKALLDSAKELRKQSSIANKFAVSCRAANTLGNVIPAIDCDTIPVNDEEPIVNTGAVATGSLDAMLDKVIAPVSEVPELIIDSPEKELISEIDRSDSHLTEIARNLIWRYNANGYAQSPVGLTASGTESRSKQMLIAYDFDKRFNLTKDYGWELFKKVGARYKIKPEFLVCVAKADSSLGRWLKTDNNIGNVGNNDRGNKIHFESIGAGIDHIGAVLSNKYLGYKQSIGSLTPVGGGDSPYYSTSKEGNWYNNVRNCLAEIYNDSSVGPNFMFRN
jgi:hypothetical protein